MVHIHGRDIHAADSQWLTIQVQTACMVSCTYKVFTICKCTRKLLKLFKVTVHKSKRVILPPMPKSDRPVNIALHLLQGVTG